jgi:hypothetical protein
MLKTYLWICFFVNAVIGFISLLDPVAFLGAVQIGVTEPGGAIELRAMYGGLQLGLAAFVFWCLRDEKRWHSGAMLMVLMLAGLGGTRLCSWLLAMPEGMMHPSLFTFELGGAVVGWVLMRRS